MSALDDARTAVAGDLGPGDWDELLDDAVEHRRWWLEQWPDGAELVLCLLAQDVQEAVHEAAGPLWPACRERSCEEVGQHAMHVEPDLGTDPFWVCTRTGLPVAPVGHL